MGRRRTYVCAYGTGKGSFLSLPVSLSRSVSQAVRPALPETTVFMVVSAMAHRCRHTQCLLHGALACLYVCSACARCGDGHTAANGPCRHLAEAHDLAGEHAGHAEGGQDLTSILHPEDLPALVQDMYSDSGSDMDVMGWLLSSFGCARRLLVPCGRSRVLAVQNGRCELIRQRFARAHGCTRTEHLADQISASLTSQPLVSERPEDQSSNHMQIHKK